MTTNSVITNGTELRGTPFTFWTFFDERDRETHLVRQENHGTPGLTLCGQDRFVRPARGGSWAPDEHLVVCNECVRVLVRL